MRLLFRHIGHCTLPALPLTGASCAAHAPQMHRCEQEAIITWARAWRHTVHAERRSPSSATGSASSCAHYGDLTT